MDWRFYPLICLLISLGAGTEGRGATYTWNQTSGGTYSWIVTSNWTPAGAPNGAGDVANLSNNISGDQTVNLNSTITIGTLNMGDSNGSNTFTLAAGTGGSLTFDVTTGSAAINKVSGANANDAISATVTFNDTFDITNNSTGSLAFTGGLSSTSSNISFNGTGTTTVQTNGISTSGGLTKNGTGTLNLSAANTYTGITTLSNGTLALGNTNALLNSTLDTGASSVTKAVTFTVSGTNTYRLGGLAGADDINMGANRLIIGVNNASTTYSGILSGTGGFTKVGTGTLTLSGANTYTGRTLLFDGSLALADVDALKFTTIDTLTSSATKSLVFAVSGNKTYNLGGLAGADDLTIGGNSLVIGWNNESTVFTGSLGVASGNGDITKVGTGILTLGGGNNYKGLTTISAGALNIQNGSSLGGITNGTTVASGAALEIEGGITVGAEALTINGTGINNGGALRNTSGDNTYQGAVTLGSASRINSDSGTLTLSSVTMSGNALTVGGDGNTSIGNIGNGAAGSLTKEGTGMLTLSGTNNFTGATAVTSGTLSLDYSTQNNSKLSDSASLTLGGSSTLELSGGSHTEIVGSTTITSGANTVSRTSGTSVLQMGALTRNIGATLNFSAANIARTDTLNTNGIIGAWATINGSDWAMNSTNGAAGLITAYTAYTNVTRLGPSTIANGATTNVRIIDGGTSGNITLGGVTTTDISTLKMEANAGAATIDPTSGQILRLGVNGGLLMASGSGALTVGTAANDGTLTVGGAANTAGVLLLHQYSSNILTINSTIANNGTGAARLTLSGTGTVVLTGTNTYTGLTTVNDGILSISSDANLGAVPGSPTADMLVLHGGTLATTANMTLNANRGLTIDTGGGTLDVDAGTTLTYNGVIAGVGDIYKKDTGTFITGGAVANTQSGDLYVDAGIFEVAKTANVSGISDSSTTTIAAGATLRFNGTAAYTQETIGSLSGDGIVDNIGLADVTLIAGGDNTDTTFSGVIKNTGTKVTNLQKEGIGTMKLTGTNSYTGTTTVNAGVLQIDGVITSAVMVNAGATLSGSGSVTKAVTIMGAGALRPGNKTLTGSDIGTFTLSGTGSDGNLTAASTVILGLQLGANGISFANQSTTYYTSPGVLNSNYTTAPLVAGANDRIVVGGDPFPDRGSRRGCDPERCLYTNAGECLRSARLANSLPRYFQCGTGDQNGHSCG